MHAAECQLHLPHLGMFPKETDQPPKVSASHLHLASSAAAAPLRWVVPPLVAPRLVVLLFHKVELLLEVQALPTPTSALQAHPQALSGTERALLPFHLNFGNPPVQGLVGRLTSV